MPSIYTPPWAGGDPRRGLFLLVVGPDKPPREPPRLRSREQEPPAANNVAEASHARALVKRGHWHFHQLFCRLRLRENCALREASWKVILGASITCSGTTVSSGLSTSTSWSTICGTGASSSGTSGTGSTIYSTVRRCTRSCGPDTSSRRSGREPLAAGTSSTSIG